MNKNIAGQLSKFSRREIAQLFKKAKSTFRSPGIEIRLAPAMLSHGRFLIVIPKKVGSAPLRNRIRRQIKSIIYQNEYYTKNFDGILFIYPQKKLIAFEELENALHKVFSLYQ